MGKTKIKTIDDSQQPSAEVKSQKSRQRRGSLASLRRSGPLAAKVKTKSEEVRLPDLVKTSDKTKRVKIDETPLLSETDEVRSGSTSFDVHEPDRVVSEQSEEVELKKQTQSSERSSKPRRPGKAKPRSKKYLEKTKLVDPHQKYPLEEAVKLAQTTSYSSFPGTIEVHLNTTVKNLRGLVSLPFAAGKKLRVLVFGSGLNKDAPEFEGVIWGDDETISKIENNKIDFDIVVTTPEWMPKLAKVAKVLGPKGLMPNPKNGTITENLAKTILELQSGKIEYKTQTNSAVIHLPIGKVKQSPEEISTNVKTLLNTIGKSKITKITLTASMGPGVKIDLSTI